MLYLLGDNININYLFSIKHLGNFLFSITKKFERCRLKRGVIVFYHKINILKANQSSYKALHKFQKLSANIHI